MAGAQPQLAQLQLDTIHRRQAVLRLFTTRESLTVPGFLWALRGSRHLTQVSSLAVKQSSL